MHHVRRSGKDHTQNNNEYQVGKRSDPICVDEPKPKPLPKEFGMSQNYPNPFNAQTTIQYALPKDARVKVEIYDILGQRVTTLVDGVIPAGYQRVVWNAAGQPSGVYFYRISTNNENRIGRMLLVR